MEYRLAQMALNKFNDKDQRSKMSKPEVDMLTVLKDVIESMQPAEEHVT